MRKCCLSQSVGLLMSCAIVLLELMDEAHLELVAHKQVLVGGLVQVVPVQLDDPSLVVIVVLGQIVEGVLQPDGIT